MEGSMQIAVHCVQMLMFHDKAKYLGRRSP